MITFTNTLEIVIPNPCVVSIGKFDGEHTGHQKILATMREIAKEYNSQFTKDSTEKEKMKLAIFTFKNPPIYIMEDIKEKRQIMTNEEKREKLCREGVDYLIEYPFTKEIASITGENFIRKVLIKQMNMNTIVAGTDCAFGYQKSGNIALLKSLSKEFGYQVIVIEKVRDKDNQEISSSQIRKLMQEGKIAKVNTLLGSVYKISGKVVSGNKIGGSKLGFPTANIFPPKEKLLPKHGVYASKIRIKSSDELFYGLTFIGTNPSIYRDKDNHSERVETWIFNFHRMIYNEEVEVLFYKFIRGQMVFRNLEELKKQIQEDKDLVAKYWGIL